ncbi:hypothetical protein BOX15_Mlig023076g1, partial [Macrostomum lignano]
HAAASMIAQRLSILSCQICRSWLRSLSSNAGSLATSLRSHACGQLSSSLAGQPATLCGWLARLRNRGQFALLRDRYGTVQVVPANPAARAALRSAPLESTLQVSGLVQLRPERDRNPSMPTGEIELVADTVTVMGPVANEAVPLLPQNADRGMPETRLKYRHLALRSDSMQCRLELRSSLLHSLRRFLVEQHRFVELETPTLFRATPGGAREFVVPARLHRGRGERCQGYSLVQSPQQLKQLLMMAGFDRYFQLARCYRDESGRPDRQPEFTQLDLEMSFADDSDILPLVEAALLAAWPTEFNGERLPRPPSQPFQRISYADAMLRYGTDKPDTRFGLTAQRWTLPSSVTVVGFRVSADELTDGRQLTLPAVDALRQALAESPLAAGWQLSDGKTFRNETLVGLADCCGVADDDLVLHGPESQIGSQVAAARLALHSALVSTGSLPALDWRDWRLIWVDQFPLFEADNDSNSRLRSCHHPFTAPVPEHLDGLLSGELPPAEVIGRHFDLVCNGCELGGGSVRIHDPRLQKLVLEKVLGLDPEPMRHLIEALGHGAPPHVGIALGVDRLVSLLTGADCIADCMAFPKTQEGRCLLSGAPALIDANTLDYYRLRPAAEQTDCSN